MSSELNLLFCQFIGCFVKSFDILCHSVLFSCLWSQANTQISGSGSRHLNFFGSGSNIYKFLAPAPKQFGLENKKKTCIICITHLFHKLYLWNRNPNFRIWPQPSKITWDLASITLAFFISKVSSSLTSWLFPRRLLFSARCAKYQILVPCTAGKFLPTRDFFLIFPN